MQPIKQNSKRTACNKTCEPFLLTTKLFCEICNCAITVVGRTSYTGEKYAFIVVSGRKTVAGKKTLSKDLIEKAVI